MCAHHAVQWLDRPPCTPVTRAHTFRNPVCVLLFSYARESLACDEAEMSPEDFDLKMQEAARAKAEAPAQKQAAIAVRRAVYAAAGVGSLGYMEGGTNEILYYLMRSQSYSCISRNNYFK